MGEGDDGSSSLDRGGGGVKSLLLRVKMVTGRVTGTP